MLDALVCHDLTTFADRGWHMLRSLGVPIRHLHVVCVLPRIDPGHPGVVWPADEDEPRRRHALRELDRRFSGHDVVFHVVVGEPGARIVEVARETGVQLIALPTHGRTGLPRLVRGSVAEHVSRFAPCPVLVLPPHADLPEPERPPGPTLRETPAEMVDALAVQVCHLVEHEPGWLASITVALPLEGAGEDWIEQIATRLAAAGIDNVDVLTTRHHGPLALLYTRFEEA